MKRTRSRWFLLLAGFALACIQAPVRVETVTTPGADLSRVRSFAQVPPEAPHPTVGETIEREIRKVLLVKGLSASPLESADVAVGYRASGVERTRVRTQQDPDTWGYRVRERYVDKTIEIDFFDAATRQVLWRGIGQIDVVSEPSQPAAAAKAVRAILAEFPPGEAMGAQSEPE